MKNTQASEIFREFLKHGQNRVTPERFEVLDSAIEYQGHFGADDLYIVMKNQHSRVSRATVYNTLELLVQCNLLGKRNFGENLTRYECNFRKQVHHHLICIDCGRIVEFPDTHIKNVPETIATELGFKMESYSFNIYASCKNIKTCKYHKQAHRNNN